MRGEAGANARGWSKCARKKSKCAGEVKMRGGSKCVGVVAVVVNNWGSKCAGGVADVVDNAIGATR